MSEEFQVDASADLWAQANERAANGLTLEVCLTELIDNALDAGARRVRVVIEPNKLLRISDDGSGIPDINALVRFGGHVPHAMTRSGAYGVGHKDAALSLGGVDSTVHVTTTTSDLITKAVIEWVRLRTEPTCLRGSKAPASGERTGTTIEIAPIRKLIRKGAPMEKVLDSLSYVYSTALRAGAALRVSVGGDVHQLRAWQPPKLSEVVDQHIEINGKRAHLRAGIVAPGEKNPKPGLTYSHGYRVIKKSSGAGCGAFDVSRICGVVELDEEAGWQRTKNKTDLVDADDLYEEVERLLRPLLEKSSSAVHTIELTAALGDVSKAIGDALFGPAELKAKRGRGDQHGSIEPSNTGGKHRDAAVVQPGSTFGRKLRAKRISLQLIDGWEENRPIGHFESAAGVARVSIYKDHPYVAAALTPFDHQRIGLLAMTVLAHHVEHDSVGQLAMATTSDVLVRLATIAATTATVDGRNVTTSMEAAE